MKTLVMTATMPNRVTALGVLLLLMMGVLMVISVRDDALTYDEGTHIAAGYSYLRRADYRMNLEHPPLMKDLAALPLLFMHLYEPWDDETWLKAEERDFGNKLLYGSGNDPDAIAFASRTPMMLVTLLFGWILFRWTAKEFGYATALLTLFFYVFSPTFIAHGRLVTNDVGAAAAFFLGVIALLQFLKNPGTPAVVRCALALTFALLTKFSTFLLVPIYLALIAGWMILMQASAEEWRTGIKQATAILVFAALMTGAFYGFHIAKFSPQLQRERTQFNLAGRGVGNTLKQAVTWASDKGMLRPAAAYFGGVFAAVQRSHEGNSAFFFGAFRSPGTRTYFPAVFLIKEPLPYILMLAVVAGAAARRLGRSVFTRQWLRAHFTEASFLLVVVVYWITSIESNLNIGVRHILPVFPLMYVLVANGAVRLWDKNRSGRYGLALTALLMWQAWSVLSVHPSYLAYFNELAGGPDGGYRYVTDSNVDWGQDLKRLAQFVEERKIPKIYLEYFGGGDSSYYLKEKYVDNSGCHPQPKGWIAVSAMSYQGPPWMPACDYRRWLPIESAVARIGHSIFVFHVD